MKTNVFKFAKPYGYYTGRQLARAMGITPSMLSRVEHNHRRISATFIAGALRAFPNMTFDELFIIEPVDSESADVA